MLAEKQMQALRDELEAKMQLLNQDEARVDSARVAVITDTNEIDGGLNPCEMNMDGLLERARYDDWSMETLQQWSTFKIAQYLEAIAGRER